MDGFPYRRQFCAECMVRALVLQRRPNFLSHVRVATYLYAACASPDQKQFSSSTTVRFSLLLHSQHEEVILTQKQHTSSQCALEWVLSLTDLAWLTIQALHGFTCFETLVANLRARDAHTNGTHAAPAAHMRVS